MIKVGLYSVTYSGTWYDGPALTVAQFIDKAKELGYDGIELDLKRPHGFPLDLTETDRREIRRLADRAGLEIPAVAANNNFASPIPERREAELALLHEQMKLARDLGAPLLRVFAAWRGITYRSGVATYDVVKRYEDCQNLDSTRLERWGWVRDCLSESAERAEKLGVTLALQDHEPLIRGYEYMLDMVREIASESLRCCLDAPCEPSQEEEYLVEAVRATGDLQVLSHYNGEWVREASGKVALKSFPFLGVKMANYPVFIRELSRIGYDGYMNFEFCHPALAGHRIQGQGYVDEQAALALEYMRELIRSQ